MKERLHLSQIQILYSVILYPVQINIIKCTLCYTKLKYMIFLLQYTHIETEADNLEEREQRLVDDCVSQLSELSPLIVLHGYVEYDF